MVMMGGFAFSKHNPTLQFEQISRLQPSAIKAFVHLTDDGWWREVMARAPGAYGVVVDGERSDNPDMGNPRGDAEAGAAMLAAHPSAPRRIMGKNELLLSTHAADHWQRWLEYHIAYKRRARELGFAVAMGALNTGHPAIALFGDAADQWERLDPLDAEMDDNDCWDLHSYWNEAGPLACWPWTTGRHLRCPTRHKILIGECGYDRAVFAPPGTDNHGWGGILSAEQYVSQLVEYHQMLTDPRIVGTCVFLHDYDNPRWASWDITPIVDQLVARRAEFALVHPLATMPTRLAKPIISDRITQTFAQHQANTPLGGWGLDWSAGPGTPVVAAAGGVVDRVEDQGTTGYGKWVQVNGYSAFYRYAHLSRQDVVKGQHVSAGQQIGLSGNSGNSSGGHLHFETIDLKSHVWSYRVDPAPLLGIGGQPVPDPIPPTDMISRMRNHLWANLYPAGGVPCVPDNAFYKAAKTWGLGAPTTREVNFEDKRMQGFMLGWVWAVVGQWGSIHKETWL